MTPVMSVVSKLSETCALWGWGGVLRRRFTKKRGGYLWVYVRLVRGGQTPVFAARALSARGVQKHGDICQASAPFSWSISCRGMPRAWTRAHTPSVQDYFTTPRL